MRIVPTLIVFDSTKATKRTFSFGYETLKLDGEEIHCITLYRVDDPDIIYHTDVEKMKVDCTFSPQQAKALLDFMYEKMEKPEGYDSEAHIKALQETCRHFRETSGEDLG